MGSSNITSKTYFGLLVGNNDTKVLSMLWAEADKYDELVLSMFRSFRQLLNKSNSKSDTSRGVIESNDEVPTSFHFYCTWELINDGDKLIVVTLSSENYKFQPMLRVQNCSLQTDQFIPARSEGIYEKLRQLITESSLRDDAFLGCCLWSTRTCQGNMRKTADVFLVLSQIF